MMQEHAEEIEKLTKRNLDYKVIAHMINEEPHEVIAWLKTKNLPVHYSYKYRVSYRDGHIYFLNIQQAAEYLEVSPSTIRYNVKKWGLYRTKFSEVFFPSAATGIKNMWINDFVYVNGKLYKAMDLMNKSEYQW